MNSTAAQFKKDLANKYKSNMVAPRKKVDLRSDIVLPPGQDLIDKSRLSMDQCMAERNIPQDDRFVFQRVLGHQEIQYGHRWCYRDECWMC